MALKITLLAVLWTVAVFAVTTTATTTVAPGTPTTTAAPGAATTTAATTTAATTTAAPGTPTTTAAPGIATTSAAPGTATTTAAPGTPTTTAAPGTATTTAAPGTPTTTAAPGTATTTAATTTAPTTTAAPGTATTTAAPGTPTTTAAPGTPTATPESNVTSPTTSPTPEPDPCNSNPCGDRSTCEARANQTFVCLCPAGETYNNEINRCETAKVFPGEFQTNLVFEAALAIKTSPEFRDASQNITDDMRIRLEGLPNADPVVLELRPGSPVTRSVNQTVIADVQIIFPADSVVTSQTLTATLTAPCETCTVTQTFTTRSLCDVNACDAITSVCNDADGIVTCPCRPGYTPSISTPRLCIAACPIGQKLTNEGCVKCPFGYTGFNCEEKWQLYLVIAACVLGGLLLISIIVVAVVASKSSKKSSKKSNGPQTRNTYSGNSTYDFNQRATGNRSPNGLGYAANDQAPRIPRATTNSNWTNLEMTQSNSRQSLTAPTRPQNNPYAINRPQYNPYAQNQGRTNASYMKDRGE